MKIADFFQTFSYIERLERQARSGWHQAGVRVPENVASHSYSVAMIAMWIADYLKEEGERVDVELVLRMALLHDVEEALTSDIPKPVKSQFTNIDEVEEASCEMVLAGVLAWKKVVEKYKAHESLEAKIVKSADVLQMQMMALQYERGSRLDLSSFFKEDLDLGIAIANTLSREIFEMHKIVISH